MSSEATLEEMIASITSGKGIITFSGKDLPPAGLAPRNALYVTIISLQKYLPLP